MPQHSDYRKLYNSMVEAFNEVALNFFVVEVAYDKKGCPVDVIYHELNSATERLIGKSRSEIIGKSRKELFGNVNDEFPSKFDGVLKTGCPTHFQTYGAALNKYYDVYAWKIDENQVAVLLTDITERKKAAETLELSEKRYHQLFTTMTEQFQIIELLYDKKGHASDYRIVDVNPAFERLVGRTKASLIGKCVVKDLWPVEQYWLDCFDRVIKTGKADYCLNYGSAFDKFYELYVYKINETQLATIGTDITERKKTEEALLQSNIKINEIIESIQEYFYALDCNWNFIYINKQAAKLFGTEPHQLIGKNIWEVFPRAVGSAFEQNYRAAMEKREVRQFEAKGVAANVWLMVTVFPSHEGITALAVDITERKKIEEALKESEGKYRLIVETANEGIWMVSPDGKTTFVNQRMADMLGYSKKDILGHTGLEFIDSQQKVQVFENRKLLKDNKNVRFECKFIRKDGQTLWTQANTVPIFDGDGKHLGNIAMHTDITEHKLADEAVKRQAKLIDLSPDAIIVRQVDGLITFWSNGAQNLYGYSPEEAVGQISHKLLQTVFPAPLPLIEKEVETKGRWNGELIHLTKTGAEVIVQSRWLTEKVGQTLSIIESNIDITERKNAEEAINRQTIIQQGARRILEAALKGTREELGEVCLLVAEEITKSKFGFIGELNPNGLEDIAISNPGWDACKIITAGGHRKPPGNFKIHGIYGRVLSDGKSFYTNDPAHHPDSIGLPKGHPPLKSFLGVPLKSEGKTIGMIAVGNKNPGFDQRDLEALESLEPYIVEAFFRKNAEKSLKESEERFSAAFNASPIPLIVSRWRDGKYIYVNQAFLRLFEYKMEEVIGRTSPELNIYANPTGRSAFLKRIGKGHVNGLEMAFRTKTGKILHTLISTEKISIAGEDHIVTSLVDITDRKKQQEKTEDQATLINLSPDAIIIKKIDDTITFWSKGAEELYGWTEEEAIGQKSRQLFKTKFPEPYEEILAELHSKGSWTGEKVHTTKAGKQIVVNSRWRAKRNEKHQLFEIFETNEDITTRKIAETDLKQRTEQLEVTQKKLEENAILLEEYANQMEELAKQRLYQLKDAERLAAIGATAGMVGHDIRNPLQGITGELYFAKKDLMKLEENPTTLSIKENLLAIEKSVGYINKIVQDLQDFARPIKAVLNETNLEELTRNTLLNLRVPDNVSTVCSIDESAKCIQTDPVLLRRVLTNLANNAIEAMQDGGKLEIDAFRRNNAIVISVSDTGAGIPDEVKPKLFTPLVTTKSKGQGFGLSVVKRMTEALDGSVTFESTIGKGTTFMIKLPQP